MSKKVKRTISVIIAAIMLLSTMSVLAFADLPTYPEAASKYVAKPHTHVAPLDENGEVKYTLSTYVQPTCVKEGSKEYIVKCTICGEAIPGMVKKVAIDPLDSHHQAGPVSIEKIKQPTCDAEGSYYEVVRCVLCNEVLSKTLVKVSKTNAHVADLPVKQRINAAGQFEDGVNEATCAEEGSYWSVTYCKVCGEVLACVLKTIPKNPSVHKNLSGAIVKPETKRTCADGEVTCLDCGAVIQAQIPHTWDAGKVVVKATPTTQGMITYNCLIKGCTAHFDVTTPVTKNPSKVGDVDGDGKVTTADARYILRYAVGLGNYDKVITALTVEFADFDGNKTVEPADARMALRAAVGLPN